MTSPKRLRRRAHQRESKDADRLTLAPLTFEEAVKGALATKPTKTDEDSEQKEGDDGDSA
jgi:hypothetical protein